MKPAQVKELLLQSLEHERAGIKVCETALQWAVNDELEEEWEKYLEQTRNHERILLEVFSKLSLDPEETSPERTIAKQLGVALLQAMQTALKAADPGAAELIACECVVFAEMKDHADWKLIKKCAEHATGHQKMVLSAAADEVEDQQEEHLYHSKSWCRRELWVNSAGFEGPAAASRTT